MQQLKYQVLLQTAGTGSRCQYGYITAVEIHPCKSPRNKTFFFSSESKEVATCDSEFSRFPRHAALLGNRNTTDTAGAAAAAATAGRKKRYDGRKQHRQLAPGYAPTPTSLIMPPYNLPTSAVPGRAENPTLDAPKNRQDKKAPAAAAAAAVCSRLKAQSVTQGGFCLFFCPGLLSSCLFRLAGLRKTKTHCTYLIVRHAGLVALWISRSRRQPRVSLRRAIVFLSGGFADGN